MSYKLEAKHPDLEDGIELDFGGVLIKNGGSKTLTEEEEAGLVARYGKSVKDALGNSPYLKLSGSTELSKKGGEG